MCVPVAAAIIGSAVLGAGVSMYQGSKSRKQAAKAQAANEASAAREAQRAETQFNQANQKMPAIAQIWDKNRQQASRGLGSTFLTGTKGVTQLPLGGAASLLGG